MRLDLAGERPKEIPHVKARMFSLTFVTAAIMLASAAKADMSQYDPAAPAELTFTTLPPQPQTTPYASSAKLPQWNGSFLDQTLKVVNFTMVGTNPMASKATTNVGVVIIPIKFVFPKSNGNATFDPENDKAADGNSTTLDTLLSPLFNDVNFTQGGTNLGTTQYIDAFQRGNFWIPVEAGGASYHVLLLPTFVAEPTVVVTSARGKVIANPFGGSGKVGILDNKWYNDVLQSLMKKYVQINPGVLPLFLTDNVYVLEKSGKCCDGGYHSSNGAQPHGQTYATAAFGTEGGQACIDVSCISHELAEWLDDPFINNHVNCSDNSLMEVADPVNGHNYPYVSIGNTYHLQSLVFIGYFGGNPVYPPSVNGWLSFQNDMSHLCPGQ